MDARQSGAVGFAGVAFGNLLLAVGNSVAGKPLVLIGVQVAATLSFGLLAGHWFVGTPGSDSPEGTIQELMPLVLLVSGAAVTFAGITLVAVTLTG